MNKIYFLVLVLTSNFLSAMHVPKEVLEEFPALAHTFVGHDDGKSEPAQSTAVPKINASALQLVLPASVAKRKFSCIYPACTSAVEYSSNAHNNNTFIALENFVEHVKSHAADTIQQERDPRIIMCRNAGCTFGSSIAHLIIKHQEDCLLKSGSSQRADDAPSNICCVCSKNFNTVQALVNHLGRHTSNSNFICPYALQGCSYESLYSSNYHRHVRACKFKPKVS